MALRMVFINEDDCMSLMMTNKYTKQKRSFITHGSNSSIAKAAV
jgi:hypothetical protein